MGRTYKTEAVVLRSFRLGEADRVLHVYTADRGRVGAVAKGVRRTKSRFGARLEPLSHVELMLHQGSGDLQTVTGADLRSSHHESREDPYRLSVGLIGAEAMLRLFPEQEANQRAFTALTRFLDRLDETPSRAPVNLFQDDRSSSGRAGRVRAEDAGSPRAGSTWTTEDEGSRRPARSGDTAFRSETGSKPALDPLVLSFQLKLLWLSGYMPHLESCVECGAVEGLVGYLPAAGGAVCRACGPGAIPLSPSGAQAIQTLVATPLADAGDAGLTEASAQEALAIVRASYEHQGGFRLRTLSA